MTKCLVVVVLFLLYLSRTEAADCVLPSKSRLDVLLENEVTNKGGEGGATITPLDEVYYTCQVQGNTKGTYQDLSVIMQYTVPGDTNVRTRQFEAYCSGGIDWESSSGSLTTPPNNYASLSLRTNCSDCDNTAGNDNHCDGCHSSCTEGLMRCTSDSSSDCCAAFEEGGTCKTDLDCNQPNFVANEQNNYTCACGISSCGDGYTFNSSSCSCYLTDICAAITPCDNGECILGSSADMYTCNCTGTNFMGTNCSDPIPTPSSTILTPGDRTTSMMMAMPSNFMTCDVNCDMCNDSNCCIDCKDGYSVNGCNCTITLTTRPPSPVCNVPGCANCSEGLPVCCERCEDDHMTSRRNPCLCEPTGIFSTTTETTTTSTRGGGRNTAVSPTHTGTPDRSSIQSSATSLIGIIVTIIVGIIMLLVFVILIIYIVYYFIGHAATGASKADISAPFLKGEAHNNPMYLGPDDLEKQ